MRRKNDSPIAGICGALSACSSRHAQREKFIGKAAEDPVDQTVDARAFFLAGKRFSGAFLGRFALALATSRSGGGGGRSASLRTQWSNPTQSTRALDRAALRLHKCTRHSGGRYLATNLSDFVIARFCAAMH